jgi:hydroxylamine reductase
MVGVCGKTPEAAALEDLLMYSLKGLGKAGSLAPEGALKTEAARFAMSALFSTLTNVNFDQEDLGRLVREALLMRKKLEGNGANKDYDPLLSMTSLEEFIEEGEKRGIRDLEDPVLFSLRETALYGLKGLAAYAHHASILGEVDHGVCDFVFKVLGDSLDKGATVEDSLGLLMDIGEKNLKVMALLDRAHEKRFGVPVPTKVLRGHIKGPAILVSGHDLFDLYELLTQTEGSGVNIYTHGEMLPAKGYPELSKFQHLIGHFGTAWQKQHDEFPNFSGAILFTTNCLQVPKKSYLPNTFTTGPVACPGTMMIKATHGRKDFSPVIERAKALGGFSEDLNQGFYTVGFGHKSVLSMAAKILDCIKNGEIKHFFLVGGCDGSRSERSYFRDFVMKAPKDTVILTLGCGKYRFWDLELGEISGIPRLLDLGQCNDAYSAVQIAIALKIALGVDLNSLPITLVLSWYEQKAVSILLTLLYLGFRNIRLGPTLPAFIHPDVLKILVEKWDLAPITTPDRDLEQILKH